MKFLKKFYQKLNTVSKIILFTILILVLIQLFQTYERINKIDEIIPIDLKVEAVRFENGYIDRYFFDTYVDIQTDRNVNEKDLELLGVVIIGESIELNQVGDKTLRATFKSEFLPQEDRLLQVSYGGNVFFEKAYRNEGSNEEDALKYLPRSLNVE